MNNIMKFFAAACFLVNVLCFGMDAPKKMIQWDRDIVFHEVAPRADIPTQRNIRATCRYGEKNIKIDELEKGRNHLAEPLTFCSVWLGGPNRPNDSVSDFKQLKKIFELTEIEGKSPTQAKALRLLLVNAIAPWDERRDFSSHGQRTGLYGLRTLYEKGNEKFAAQLDEQHPYNNEYCTIS